METPDARTGRSHRLPQSGERSEKATGRTSDMYADGEVRWSHSTYETGEQNRNTGSGVRGGKGATEGEDTQHTLEPDTVPDCSSPYACCASTACKDL